MYYECYCFSFVELSVGDLIFPYDKRISSSDSEVCIFKEILSWNCFFKCKYGELSLKTIFKTSFSPQVLYTLAFAVFSFNNLIGDVVFLALQVTWLVLLGWPYQCITSLVQRITFQKISCYLDWWTQDFRNTDILIKSMEI